MARTASAAKTAKETPAIVKAAPKAPAKKVVSGPKGKNLVEAKPPEDETPAEVTAEQREGERRQAQANAVMQFSNTQLSGPAAHPAELTDAQHKMAAFKEAQAKLAAEMGIELAPEAPPAPLPKATKLQQNNITRPADDTKTGLVWRTADAISAGQNGCPASIAQMKEHKDMHDVNDHTLKTQYARWRAYNGVKGRQQTIKPVVREGVYDAALPVNYRQTAKA